MTRVFLTQKPTILDKNLGTLTYIGVSKFSGLAGHFFHLTRTQVSLIFTEVNVTYNASWRTYPW
jgi:hypothetical protein